MNNKEYTKGLRWMARYGLKEEVHDFLKLGATDYSGAMVFVTEGFVLVGSISASASNRFPTVVPHTDQFFVSHHIIIDLMLSLGAKDYNRTLLIAGLVSD